MKKLIILFTSIVISSCSTVLAQVAIQVPPVKGNNVSEFLVFNVLNNSAQSMDGHISIFLKREGAGLVATFMINNIRLNQGSNLVTKSPADVAIVFQKGKSSAFLLANDKLENGNYEACWSFTRNDKPGVAEASSCMTFRVESLTPLLLNYPVNNQTICDERPLFQWLAPEINNGDHVRFLLVEKRADQSPLEAISRNIPLVDERDVDNRFLSLPGQVNALKDGKEYAWQVTIYNAKGIVKKSDTWMFRKGCDKPASEQDAYAFPQLRNEFDGNYYSVKDKISFTFTNSYGTEKLDYRIVDISTNKTIKYYPEVKIVTGSNLISIDVNDCAGLKKGNAYTLVANNINTRPMQMRFIYAK